MISEKNSLSFMNTCELVSITTIENELGETSESETKSELFCAEIPVHSSRKDVARAQGIRLTKCLVVNSDEYSEDILYIEYGGVRYAVYDTYPRPDGYTEITLKERVGDNVESN